MMKVFVLWIHFHIHARPKRYKAGCAVYHFQCDDLTCISDVHICDGEADCRNAEDEKQCGCNAMISSISPLGYHHQCMSLTTGQARSSCHPMEFICNKEKCIPYTHVCDGIHHCKNGADEFCSWIKEKGQVATDNIHDHIEASQEEICSIMQTNISAESTSDVANQHQVHRGDLENKPENMLTCDPIKRIWFEIHEICVYNYDDYGILLPCENGAHLENCKEFECSGMFKCPNSYCLPYHRVCDGTTDCLTFEDERMCQVYVCEGMLHCKGEKYCVHILDTCDGNPNCPLWDDELNCDHGMCPRNCITLSNAYNV